MSSEKNDLTTPGVDSSEYELDLSWFKREVSATGILNENWERQDSRTKSRTMSLFCDVIAQAYLKEYAPNMEYQDYGISKARFSDIETKGVYTSNNDVIKINNNYLRNQAETISTMAHESTHYAQTLLIESPTEKLSKEEREHRALLLACRQDHKTESFGIVTTGRTYIQAGNFKDTQYYDLAYAMYSLTPTEREARQASIQACKVLNLPQMAQKDGDKLINQDSTTKRALATFRERYVVGTDISDEELMKLYDNAIINVSSGRVPTNPIEASMTYDLTVMLRAQSASQTVKPLVMDLFLQSQNKAAKMSKYGFENTMTISISDAKTMLPNKLSTLTTEELQQNPHVIAYGVMRCGPEAFKQSPTIYNQLTNSAIGDCTFDNWYFSKSNPLSDAEKTVVASELGEKYSLENYNAIVFGDQQIQFTDLTPQIDLDQLFNDQNQSRELRRLDVYAQDIDLNDHTDYFAAGIQEQESTFKSSVWNNLSRGVHSWFEQADRSER